MFVKQDVIGHHIITYCLYHKSAIFQDLVSSSLEVLDLEHFGPKEDFLNKLFCLEAINLVNIIFYKKYIL